MSSFWLRRGREARSPQMALLASLVLAAASLLASAHAQKAEIAGLAAHQPVTIKAQPFNFAPAGRETFGRLEWRGGLRLSSSNSVFGGYSAISLSADGERLLAISDGGSWLSARVERRNGKLAGLSDAQIGPIPQKDGRPLQKRWHRDAESLARLDGGRDLDGRYFIGFEGYHRLDEYEFRDGAFHGPVRRGGLPDNLRKMPSNQGLEGVTQLRGIPNAGSLVMFAERKLDSRGDHTGSLIKGGKAYPISMARKIHYDVTDLASLKDGSLLVLERSFVRRALKLDIRLRLIPADEIKPGARLKGEVLFDADQRYTIDNFEGMDVTERADGETLITLISDDNFNFFQSTLLAQFALRE
jgi:hypothetical protein